MISEVEIDMGGDPVENDDPKLPEEICRSFYHSRVTQLDERWRATYGSTVKIGGHEINLDDEYTRAQRTWWWCTASLKIARPFSMFDTDTLQPGDDIDDLWVATSEVVDALIRWRRRGKM